jgi:hypothetical protein
MAANPNPNLELADWRRAVSGLYAAVRAERDPQAGHALWRAGRDELMRTHPQSPLVKDDPMRDTGVPYWPYDPALRFEAPLLPPEKELTAALPTGEDDVTTLRLVGRVELPEQIGGSLDVWWLQQYAGGIFLPVRDGTAGGESYGGGRYLLDTAKGADLGGTDATLVLDFNFLYHPSCRYDPQWSCPLAPRGDWVEAPLRGGERMD